MAKAKQLPSGSWRCLVFAGTDEHGKRKYESFTAPTRKKAEAAAALFALQREREGRPPEKMTVGEAIENYISGRSAILSPSTVREYRSSRRRDFALIENVKLAKLTGPTVQRWVNERAAGLSPKSVRNAYRLLTGALAEAYPELKINVKLPAKQSKEIIVPTAAEIETLTAAARGTPMEIPILLSAGCGLRRSEIAALTAADFDFRNGVINIDKAMVRGETGWHIKQPKTATSKRKVPMPATAAELLRKLVKKDPVITLNPNQITAQFEALLRKNDVTWCRFHDLRHYYASVLHALGVPDRYAAELMGHSTEEMLHKVYQHTMPEAWRDIMDRINNIPV